MWSRWEKRYCNIITIILIIIILTIILIISLNYNIKQATKYDFLQGRLKGYPIPGLSKFHRSRPVL